MIDTTDFESKKSELHFYIKSLLFLDKIYLTPSSNYDKYIKNKLSSEEYNLGDFIVILKSNAYMMMYNMIESTVRSSIYSLYDEIRTSNVKYKDVTEPIRKLWRKSNFTDLDKGNANVDKYKQTANNMINSVLNSEKIILSDKSFQLSGNADFESILQAMQNHDIKLETSDIGPYRNELRRIRTTRNNLAHGNISFIESARDSTVTDISTTCRHVENFLIQLISDVDKNISGQKFKIKSN